MVDRLVGATPYSALVEGGDPWGDVRIHRKLDARWRGVAERLLEGVTPAAYAYLIIDGNSANAETFTINGRVYELDAAPVSILATSDVGIDISGGVTPALVAPAIVAGVNADADRDVDALLLTAGGADRIVAFISRTAVGDVAGDGAAAGFAIATTMVNGTWRANRAAGAFMDSDGNPTTFNSCSGSHVVTAQDVARWLLNDGVAIAAAPFTSAPTRVQYTVMTAAPTAAGSVVKSAATVEFRWRQVNTNRWVLECVDLVPVLVAGDYIHWSAQV